jgi:hypothetical protein
VICYSAAALIGSCRGTNPPRIRRSDESVRWSWRRHCPRRVGDPAGAAAAYHRWGHRGAPRNRAPPGGRARSGWGSSEPSLDPQGSHVNWAQTRLRLGDFHFDFIPLLRPGETPQPWRTIALRYRLLRRKYGSDSGCHLQYVGVHGDAIPAVWYPCVLLFPDVPIEDEFRLQRSCLIWEPRFPASWMSYWTNSRLYYGPNSIAVLRVPAP